MLLEWFNSMRVAFEQANNKGDVLRGAFLDGRPACACPVELAARVRALPWVIIHSEADLWPPYQSC